MLAQLSIWPLDQPHMSREVADIANVLDQLSIRYEVGPMGTVIEGPWQEVMDAIHACHEATKLSHQRVLTMISIDDDSTRPLDLNAATAKVSARRKHQDSLR